MTSREIAASSAGSRASRSEMEHTQHSSRFDSCSDSDDESEIRQKSRKADGKSIAEKSPSTPGKPISAASHKTKKHEKKIKKLKKREDKTLKLLMAVVKTASNIEASLTDPIPTIEETLTKYLMEHEKVLEKLSCYIQNGKAAFLDKSIPIGLLRAVDRYEDPYHWIQREVVHQFRQVNRELKDALHNIGSFQSTLQYILLGGQPDANLRPTIAACPELGLPLQQDPSLASLLEELRKSEAAV